MPEVMTVPDAVRYLMCLAATTRRRDDGISEILAIAIVAAITAAAALAVSQTISDRSTSTVNRSPEIPATGGPSVGTGDLP